MTVAPKGSRYENVKIAKIVDALSTDNGDQGRGADILEQFFRGVRRGHRRKTGNNSIHRVLQTMLSETPLVKNLDNPAYMEILLDGKENLVELFAELGPSWITNPAAESQSETDRLLPGFRPFINNPTLPEQAARLFTSYVEQSKSN